MNPHNDCRSLTPPGSPEPRQWRCVYCAAEGTLDELVGPGQLAPCGYEYPPCTSCGQTPVCAPDCKLCIGALLGADGVIVVGSPPRKTN